MTAKTATKVAEKITVNSSTQRQNKSRKRTLLTPKRNGLKNRRDVVNKSLLRAIRRFFMVEWNKSKPTLRTKFEFKRSSLFQESVRDLVSKLTESCSEPRLVEAQIKSLSTDDEKSFKELHKIIGWFINREDYMKALSPRKVDENNRIQQFLKQFDKCCRSYSHLQFEELAKVNVMQK